MALATGSASGRASEVGSGFNGVHSAVRVGMWSAWALVALYAAYAVAVIAAGVPLSPPKDPAWAVAEILTVAGVPIQILLFAAIYGSTRASAKTYGLLAFGLILMWGALTSAVHFTELVVARRLNLTSDPALARVFDLAHQSLLQGVEFLAWHFFLGLAMLAAAVAFTGQDTARWVRTGLIAGGLLTVLGLIGPILDQPYLRSIGAIGYGVVFPVVCLLIGFVFRSASLREATAI